MVYLIVITNTMKNLFLITFLLVTSLCFGQLKSVIVNSETKETIPCVNIWIEDENSGTTSNENGVFELEVSGSKTIIFSAIGFETKKILSDIVKDVLELKPQITLLDEVVVRSKRQSKKVVIGKFNKSKIKHYFSSGSKPWIIAKYFKFNEDYNETPFLNKIKLLTNSEVENSKFNVRLYSIGGDGKPESYIYDENIIGTALKGKKITEIDISDLNIEFPTDGFFIAIEWLIIENNKHKYSYKIKSSKKKINAISYEPSIGTIPSESEHNSWGFVRGKWERVWKNVGSSKRYQNKYNVLAIELTLTD